MWGREEDEENILGDRKGERQGNIQKGVSHVVGMDEARPAPAVRSGSLAVVSVVEGEQTSRAARILTAEAGAKRLRRRERTRSSSTLVFRAFRGVAAAGSAVGSPWWRQRRGGERITMGKAIAVIAALVGKRAVLFDDKLETGSDTQGRRGMSHRVLRHLRFGQR